jgi:hypothetical protein
LHARPLKAKDKANLVFFAPAPLFLHIEMIEIKQKAPVFTGALFVPRAAPNQSGEPALTEARWILSPNYSFKYKALNNFVIIWSLFFNFKKQNIYTFMFLDKDVLLNKKLDKNPNIHLHKS